jgi:hypothetical protein
MDLTLYEYDPKFVLDKFREGDFDFIDAVSEVEETAFFRYVGAHNILKRLAETYPSPRKKQEVPAWVYVSSNLSMRLHGVHSFNAYPYVVRSGGMLNAFGPEFAHKARHPETHDVTLACEGFNNKNTYDRQTPCDQDFLRKLARDTSPEKLQAWFNKDVVKVLRAHKVFQPEGFFIGDASHLFVPDNPEYEGSDRLLFDEHDHLVESKGLTADEERRYRWRRCYKLVSILYTNPKTDLFVYVGLAVLPGRAHESPTLYKLVHDFIQAAGPGVMRRLILDRGFIDGAEISTLKKTHGVDTLIPLRTSMDLYQDVLGLMRGGHIRFAPYHPPSPKPPTQPRPTRVPAKLRKREERRQATLAAKRAEEPLPPPHTVLVRSEVGVVSSLRSWSSCTVPVNVVVNREVYLDGHEQVWMLMDTRPVLKASESRDEYRLRTAIEERHRQLKCFWDLADFKARALSLVVNQVIFVALAYSLLQLFLMREEKRPELNRRTLPRLRDQLLPSDTHIVIYTEGRYAFLSPIEYTELLLSLSEPAKKKILEHTARIRRQQSVELNLVRGP